MRPRRVRNPIKATAREPINRPDTYERFPKPRRKLSCEQQPTHTYGPKATSASDRAQTSSSLSASEAVSKNLLHVRLLQGKRDTQEAISQSLTATSRCYPGCPSARSRMNVRSGRSSQRRRRPSSAKNNARFGSKCMVIISPIRYLRPLSVLIVIID